MSTGCFILMRRIEFQTLLPKDTLHRSKRKKEMGLIWELHRYFIGNRVVLEGF